MKLSLFAVICGLGSLVVLLSLSGRTDAFSNPQAPIDIQTVYDGFFDSSQITVHVLQNFFNFVVSTIGWSIVVPLYSHTVSTITGKRKRRDIAPQQFVGEEKSDDDQTFDGEKLAKILRFMADTAESFDRYVDEL